MPCEMWRGGEHRPWPAGSTALTCCHSNIQPVKNLYEFILNRTYDNFLPGGKIPTDRENAPEKGSFAAYFMH